jgi:hypothetical protein
MLGLKPAPGVAGTGAVLLLRVRTRLGRLARAESQIAERSARQPS